MRLGVKSALVGATVVPGDVTVDGSVIAEVGVPGGAGTGMAVPGFVDLQVNGFAGVDFALTDPGGYQIATAEMAATGVTAYQPTLITLAWNAYPEALAAANAARQTRGGEAILGVHLEGPFLSPVRHGAHSPANLLEPTVEGATELLGHGGVSHVTLAPELPEALDVIDLLVSRGVTVAIGHSDADAAAAHAAIDRGATAVTHLFNAQRPWMPRDPGIAGAALVRPEVTVTAIVDGVHLSDEAVLMAYNACRGRFALITDAIAATGMHDGAHPLGDREAMMSEGESRLADGTLAGSALTMDRAVRNLAALGVPVPEAVSAATSVPAAVARRPDLGTLDPGTRADVTVLDDRLEVVRTLVAGGEVWAA